MSESLEILKKYWNHDRFREPQQQIIDAVLAKHDAFVLMPTGGGKSFCFQIPALMRDGICLVISPLVALMKDQVQNLSKKGIRAIALTGGISQNETSDLLDNCLYGNYKFLYLSPERLQSDWIVDRIKNLPINLIAIDEAHCVSQWGHDFRPAYLKIANLKTFFPGIPFLALTASATPRVQEDVIKHIGLENPQLFQKSFVRENLAYTVFNAEDKFYRLSQILTKYREPSIVYVRNRKGCIDISAQLNAVGISATYYHGGLPTKEKNKNMQLWMDEKASVMVATNAFGMGIDKANVKTVVHLQLPDNLENYYQEAGRAGRNGEKAFAVLLLGSSDAEIASRQFLSILPDKDFLKTIFVKLCNFFRIGYGEGIDEQFAFNLNQFCAQYELPILKSYNALQFLDRTGILTLSQEFSEKITAQFIIPSKEVIRYSSLNPHDEPILLAILRSYPGIHEIPTSLNLTLIAKKSLRTEKEIEELLEKMSRLEMISYSSKSNDATITFNEVREDDRTINRVSKYLEDQNKLKIAQLEAVIAYSQNSKDCKSKIIARYFGELYTSRCGICSNCIKNQTVEVAPLLITERILVLLATEDLNSRQLQTILKHSDDDVIFALQQLLEANAITLTNQNLYTIRKK